MTDDRYTGTTAASHCDALEILDAAEGMTGSSVCKTKLRHAAAHLVDTYRSTYDPSYTSLEWIAAKLERYTMAEILSGICFPSRY